MSISKELYLAGCIFWCCYYCFEKVFFLFLESQQFRVHISCWCCVKKKKKIQSQLFISFSLSLHIWEFIFSALNPSRINWYVRDTKMIQFTVRFYSDKCHKSRNFRFNTFRNEMESGAKMNKTFQMQWSVSDASIRTVRFMQFTMVLSTRLTFSQVLPSQNVKFWSWNIANYYIGLQFIGFFAKVESPLPLIVIVILHCGALFWLYEN